MLLAFMRRLTEAEVEPHPIAHHAIQVNYAPEELGRNVDQWHMDAVSFDYVLIASDPAPRSGSRSRPSRRRSLARVKISRPTSARGSRRSSPP